MADVVVVGAGVIGLGVAWRCAQRGLEVTVIDPAPGRGASATAAGMLAPTTELHYGEQALLTLNIESARRYPAFVAELLDATGVQVGYVRCGAIVAAWDAADLAALRDLRSYAATLGRNAVLVGSGELRALEPALASGLPGGLVAADDHQVDNRLLHKALSAAAIQAGVTMVQDRVARVDQAADRVTGVALASGRRIVAPTAVVAAGAWTRQLGGLIGQTLPVRPVKGQTLRLRLKGEPIVKHIIRGSVRGNAVYIVPRAAGRLVVGASSEEVGFDVTPRAGAVYELLRDAQSLLPELGEAELEEVCTGLRPGSPDNAPLIGRTGVDGLIIATGHYRKGILLTPVTADVVAELVTSRGAPRLIEGFEPTRFAASPRRPEVAVQ